MKNKTPETIGEILLDGTIQKSYYNDNLIYKNFEAFENKTDEICYSPELSDDTYTYNDFIELAKTQFDEIEKAETLAQNLFDHCNWQHPETLMDEWERESEFDEE